MGGGDGDGVVDAHKLFDRMPERNEVLGVCNATDGCSYVEYVGFVPARMAITSIKH